MFAEVYLDLIIKFVVFWGKRYFYKVIVRYFFTCLNMRTFQKFYLLSTLLIFSIEGVYKFLLLKSFMNF